MCSFPAVVSWSCSLTSCVEQWNLLLVSYSQLLVSTFNQFLVPFVNGGIMGLKRKLTINYGLDKKCISLQNSQYNNHPVVKIFTSGSDNNGTSVNCWETCLYCFFCANDSQWNGQGDKGWRGHQTEGVMCLWRRRGITFLQRHIVQTTDQGHTQGRSHRTQLIGPRVPRSLSFTYFKTSHWLAKRLAVLYELWSSYAPHLKIFFWTAPENDPHNEMQTAKPQNKHPDKWWRFWNPYWMHPIFHPAVQCFRPR